MADSKYFGIPFGTSGDKATIPEAVQPSGAISYTQGYGPDYERDPATDPLAKRVPRDETNELYFQVTNALKFLQLYGTPEWYALDDAGNPVTYPLSARVRHDAGAGMQAWRSLVASNTATPGSDAAKWALDNPFDLSVLEATLAEAIAGTSGSKIITPRRMASAVQRTAWNYAVAGGTANALTATLSPAPAAITDGMQVLLTLPNINTGAATLDLNGSGAAQIRRIDGNPVAAGDLRGQIEVVRVGGDWVLVSFAPSLTAAGSQLFAASGSVTVPVGCRGLLFEVWAGGGGGGATTVTSGAAASGGGGGQYRTGGLAVTPGETLSIVVGAGGGGGAAGTANAGGNGGNSQILRSGTPLVNAIGGFFGFGSSGGLTPSFGAGGTGGSGGLSIDGEQGELPLNYGSSGPGLVGGRGGASYASPSRSVFGDTSGGALANGAGGRLFGGGGSGGRQGGGGGFGAQGFVKLTFYP